MGRRTAQRPAAGPALRRAGGGAQVRKFDPEEAFAAHGAPRRAQCLHPADRAAHAALGARPQGRHDLQLRTVGSGGEALGAETYEWGRSALGLTINEFYGQTECNLVLSSCAAIGVSRPGAIGKPVPGHAVAVIRADGTLLPPVRSGRSRSSGLIR